MASNFFSGMGASLVGGALSGITNLFGMRQQNKNIDKQIAAQREEADIARKWNREERTQQNEWNKSMWMANNEYNTPAEQRARLEAAGMNPDLAYGGANTGNSISPSTGSNPSPSPVVDTSALASKRTIGDVASRTISDALASAEIGKKSAETSNVHEETIGTMTVNKYRDKLLQNDIVLGDTQILVNRGVVKWNEQQVKESQQLVSKMDMEISKMRSEVDVLISTAANLDVKTWETQVRVALDSKNVHTQLAIAAKQLKINEGHLINATRELLGKLPLMVSEKARNVQMASYFEQLGFKVNAEGNRINFDLSQEQEWQDFERSMNQIYQTVGTVTGVMGATKTPPDPSAGKAKRVTKYDNQGEYSGHTEYNY